MRGTRLIEKVFHRAGGMGTLQLGKVITISGNDARFRLGSVRQIAAVVLTIAACLAIPSLASAQTVDPTESQYGNTVQQISEGGSSCVDQGSSGSAAGSSNNCAPPPSSCAERAAAGSGEDCTPETSGLPFTGLDVAALAAVAGFLLLAGLGLRRARFGERTEV
jgi:hypothetical protein